MSSGFWRLEPQYLPGRSGPLFALLVAASRPRAGRESVLVIPPIGEEMNKCRPMLASQARALATRGFDVLLVDLFGTGDSAGEFAEASWEQWNDDINVAWNWLAARRPAAIHVLAVRSGALFVEVLTHSRTPTPVQTPQSKLVLWQPVTKGADFWRQILRLRLAGQSIRGSQQQLTPQELLDREGSIEIAGYRYSSSLVQSLGGAAVSPQNVAAYSATLWAEVSGVGDAALSPSGQRTVQQLQSAGANITTHALNGEPFWTTPEIASVPRLVSLTSDFFDLSEPA